jgi:hypothetical protein
MQAQAAKFSGLRRKIPLLFGEKSFETALLRLCSCFKVPLRLDAHMAQGYAERL